MFTNTCMTVFNKHTTQDKSIIYKPKVIENVFWDSTEAVKDNLDKADEVTVYIPFEKNDLSKYIDPKKYDSSLMDVWTLREGDFIVKGDLSFVSNITLIKQLKDYEAFTIYSVDIKDYGSSDMQHFKVKGK